MEDSAHIPQTSPLQQPVQSIEQIKQQPSKPEQSDFSNPVCRQTYKALPKIYGKKKKSESLSIPKHVTPVIQSQPHQIAGGNQPRSKSTDLVKQKASPKNAKQQHKPICSRKSCSCHHTEQQLPKRRRVSSTTHTFIRLPSIQKFELEDLESQHKVAMQPYGYSNADGFPKTGLQIIREQVSQQLSVDNKKKSVEKKKEHKVTTNYTKMYKIHISDMQRYKNRFKPKINSVDFNSDFSKSEDDDDQPRKIQQTTYTNLSASKHSPLPAQQESPRLIPSEQVHPFRRTSNEMTIFSSLNRSKQVSQLRGHSPRRKPSILPNGLFRVPTPSEYTDYLRSYVVMGKGFNLRELVASQGFKCVATGLSVYFGICDADAKRQGKGIEVRDKDIFEGEFRNDCRFQGYQRNIDGVYIGGFQNGLRSGHGIFHWNNGEEFEGMWVNGLKNGFGVWKSSKGDRYEGEWLNNRQHGKGTFTHRASTYKGEFQNFLKHGYGEQEFINGDKYKGYYRYGKPDGKGHYQWKDGSYYEGDFVAGMREGIGKWVEIDQTVYEGCFKADFKNGHGVETSADGQRFQGEFCEGKRARGKIFKNNRALEIREKNKK